MRTAKRSSEPASHRASSRAALLPDGTSISSSSRRSRIRRPSTSGTVDSCGRKDSSAAVRSTVINGPWPDGLSGWRRSNTYAVITFVTLAIGTGSAPPLEPSLPTPTTSTAACPSSGHGRGTSVPEATPHPDSAHTSTSITILRMPASVRHRCLQPAMSASPPGGDRASGV
ncbi:hypothetical protein GCM10020001_105390 [Nonomuraea salmonea]